MLFSSVCEALDKMRFHERLQSNSTVKLNACREAVLWDSMRSDSNLPFHPHKSSLLLRLLLLPDNLILGSKVTYFLKILLKLYQKSVELLPCSNLDFRRRVTSQRDERTSEGSKDPHLMTEKEKTSSVKKGHYLSS